MKAYEAKTSCNQVVIDSATYVNAQDQFTFKKCISLEKTHRKQCHTNWKDSGLPKSKG